jgi:hypothetical protein
VGQRQLYSKGNNPNKDDIGTGFYSKNCILKYNKSGNLTTYSSAC